MIEVNNDITALNQAERTDALLRAIIETTAGLIYAKDREGRMLLANQPALDLIGKPWPEVNGRTDLEYLDDPAQAVLVMANDRRIMDAGRAEEVEELVGVEAGQPRVWLSTKTPLRDTSQAVIGLVGVSVEITERKRAEARLRVMVDELNHRVRNTLATVQAIAAQTLRGADPAIRDALEGRLIALAAAHDVLTQESWSGANLTDVLAGSLAHFRIMSSPRFKVSGPKLRLSPKAALALALGLHELGSNALRYGALSSPEGMVEISWEVTRDAERRLRMSWTERGGPPVVPPPRIGFGARLLERSLAMDLGGTVRLVFDDPAGVVCRIEVPLSAVAASAETVPFPRVGTT